MSTCENQDDTGGISVVGFYLKNTAISDKIVYIAIVRNSVDIVAAIDGRIVFFDDIRLTSDVLALSGNASKYADSIPTEPDLLSDPYGVVQAILYDEYDKEARILHLINVLTDMLLAVGTEIPQKWRQSVYDFADHLTFDHDYTTFFQEPNHDRERVKDALLWCIGTVVVNSTLLCWYDRHGATK